MEGHKFVKVLIVRDVFFFVCVYMTQHDLFLSLSLNI